MCDGGLILYVIVGFNEVYKKYICDRKVILIYVECLIIY